jgi:hypothetical protein
MTWEQALLESIKKWERVCFEKYRGRECALCDMGNGTCPKECPIFEATGKPSCLSTPYWETSIPLKADWMPREVRHDGDILMYMFLCMLYHEYYGEENQ